MGFRTLFDQRSRAAACWQGVREASELNPSLSASHARPRSASVAIGAISIMFTNMPIHNAQEQEVI
jgi:hypothetical protein